MPPGPMRTGFPWKLLNHRVDGCQTLFGTVFIPISLLPRLSYQLSDSTYCVMGV